MNDLTLIDESIVDDSEIDSLGHMNVRFYVSRAARANFKLLAGLGAHAAPGQVLRRTDTYNRFHKEQFAGARLGVYGGLVPVEANDRVTGYYEIRNLDSQALAASFIVTTNLIDKETETSLPFPALDQGAADRQIVEVPQAGRPRSLSLATPRQATIEEIGALIPDEAKPHSINGRKQGIVLAEDCDEDGQLKEEVDPMFVLFRPQPGEDLREIGPPVQKDELGRRYSFAMMEIRSINFHRPRLGDTVISMSGDVAFGEKWRHTRRWIFASDTGQLLGISDHAAVCMDLDARRAIPIPAALKQEIEENWLPDYL